MERIRTDGCHVSVNFESLAFGTEEKQETCIYLTQALLSLVLHSFGEYGIPSPLRPEKTVQHCSMILKNTSMIILPRTVTAQNQRTVLHQPVHLSHLFKRKLGYSPMHYIVRRRIGEAQLLLVFTKKSITEIASEVGLII